MALDTKFLRLLQCPQSRLPLIDDITKLISSDQRYSYPITDDGFVLFVESPVSEDSQRQQDHYDDIASVYLETLSYPHTEKYWDYLNRVLIDAIGNQPLGAFCEICCGGGEAINFLKGQADICIGIDISANMLHRARREHPEKHIHFAQGDATNLPLNDQSVDHVVMLGGIHHVSDRNALFSEVARILKPGGRFIWREPVSDFFLWRWLRAVIYRLSPYLDHQTERPLLWSETVPVLESAGLLLETWRTYGFVGFCLFVNSDVLVFNRAFRLIPGIRKIVSLFIAFDHAIANSKWGRKNGLQVIGVAKLPLTDAPESPESPAGNTPGKSTA